MSSSLSPLDSLLELASELLEPELLLESEPKEEVLPVSEHTVRQDFQATLLRWSGVLLNAMDSSFQPRACARQAVRCTQSKCMLMCLGNAKYSVGLCRIIVRIIPEDVLSSELELLSESEDDDEPECDDDELSESDELESL